MSDVVRDGQRWSKEVREGYRSQRRSTSVKLKIEVVFFLQFNLGCLPFCPKLRYSSVWPKN